MEERASEGVMDCRLPYVYCVSRIPERDDVAEKVLPGRKKSMSPSFDSGLFGLLLAYIAGMGGTGARLL
jgi:hypothetical protein